VNGSLFGLDLCVNVSGLSNPSIQQPLTFQFLESNGTETINFLLTLENFGIVVEPNIYCLTILSNDMEQETPIVDNIAQSSHQLVFDRIHGQIHWASTTC